LCSLTQALHNHPNAIPTSQRHPNVFIVKICKIASMHPPARVTRSTNNPGVADLPKARRSPSEVAAEKEKKRETAAASAKRKQEQAARVARLESEIRVAQKEKLRKPREVNRVKRTFPRGNPVASPCGDPVDKEVSSNSPSFSHLLTFLPLSPSL
jgi:hypothetical protein